MEAANLEIASLRLQLALLGRNARCINDPPWVEDKRKEIEQKIKAIEKGGQ